MCPHCGHAGIRRSKSRWKCFYRWVRGINTKYCPKCGYRGGSLRPIGYGRTFLAALLVVVLLTPLIGSLGGVDVIGVLQEQIAHYTGRSAGADADVGRAP